MLPLSEPQKPRNAVLSAAQGTPLFSQSVVMKLAQVEEEAADKPHRPLLSSREVQVLALVGRGWDNRRIAQELELADQTVRNTISRIYRKLKVNSRAEAIIWARQCGLVED